MSASTPLPILFGRSLSAEVAKVRSVRFLKLTGLAAGIATIAVAAGIGLMVRRSLEQWQTGSELLAPQIVLLGLLTLGAVALQVGGAWVWLGEQASHTAGPTFLAIPQRSVVVLAKVALAAGFAALVSLVGILVAYVTFESVLTGTLAGPQAMLERGGARPLWALPIALACLTAIAVAVAGVVRNVAASVVLIVGWFGAGEDLVASAPVIGPVLRAAFPVGNAFNFAGVDPATRVPWSHDGSGVALGLATLLVVAVACLVAERRDVAA